MTIDTRLAGWLGRAALGATLVWAPAALAKDAKADAKAKATEQKTTTDQKDPKAATAPEAKPEAAPAPTAQPAAQGPVVEFKTTEGVIRIALDEKAAPVTVKNFLGYVADKHYDGVVFHRVIDGFMIQGGGYGVDGDKLVERKTKAPIANEAKNGLKNDRGTIAMARTGDPNSATAQFFINLVDNDRLNYPQPDGHGYAVFGKVVEGLDVVDKIGKVKTGFRGGMGDVPVTDVKIEAATVVSPKAH
jgi:peptidyl-prolyl cis-trans isomerase A (cyclophilin A)